MARTFDRWRLTKPPQLVHPLRSQAPSLRTGLLCAYLPDRVNRGRDLSGNRLDLFPDPGGAPVFDERGALFGNAYAGLTLGNNVGYPTLPPQARGLTLPMTCVWVGEWTAAPTLYGTGPLLLPSSDGGSAQVGWLTDVNGIIPFWGANAPSVAIPGGWALNRQYVLVTRFAPEAVTTWLDGVVISVYTTGAPYTLPPQQAGAVIAMGSSTISSGTPNMRTRYAAVYRRRLADREVERLSKDPLAGWRERTRLFPLLVPTGGVGTQTFQGTAPSAAANVAGGFVVSGIAPVKPATVPNATANVAGALVPGQSTFSGAAPSASANVAGTLAGTGTAPFTGSAPSATANVGGTLASSGALVLAAASPSATANVGGVVIGSGTVALTATSPSATANVPGTVTGVGNVPFTGSAPSASANVSGTVAPTGAAPFTSSGGAAPSASANVAGTTAATGTAPFTAASPSATANVAGTLTSQNQSAFSGAAPVATANVGGTVVPAGAAAFSGSAPVATANVSTGTLAGTGTAPMTATSPSATANVAGTIVPAGSILAASSPSASANVGGSLAASGNAPVSAVAPSATANVGGALKGTGAAPVTATSPSAQANVGGAVAAAGSTPFTGAAPSAAANVPAGAFAASAVTGVVVAPSSLALALGTSQQLVARVDGTTAPPPPPGVAWSTSNADVATVSPSGVVTAVGIGMCSITATSAADPAFAAVAAVAVTSSPISEWRTRAGGAGLRRSRRTSSKRPGG